MNLYIESEVELKHDLSSPFAERWALRGIFLLVLYACARAVVASISKPLWFDEIYTWIIVQQPSLADIWSAVKRGIDSQPPLFDLIERAAAFVSRAEVALRLPSIFAFACVLVCLFVFVRRRNGGIYGLIAAGTAMLTTLYGRYAIEARPYSLVAACVAVALVSYQRASSVRWLALMALALAAGESLNYYTVFAFVPFAAAEAVFFWQKRRIRSGVWIALMIGASPLVFFWPLLHAFKAIYGRNFWARPTLGVLRDVYGNILQVSSFWGWTVAIACGLAVLWGYSRARSPKLNSRISEPVETIPKTYLHEYVLVLFLIASPPFVFVAMKLFHGGYVDRYVLYSVLGLSLAVGLVLPLLGRRLLIAFSALLFIAIGTQEFVFWFFGGRALLHLKSPSEMAEKLIPSAGNFDLPVVVTDSHEFLSLAHYASRPLAPRLSWVADPPAALNYSNTDTDDRGLPLLASCYPLRVYDFQVFQSTNSSFLLYWTPGGFQNWWPDRLVRDGYLLQLVASEQDHTVFLVTRPGKGSAIDAIKVMRR